MDLIPALLKTRVDFFHGGPGGNETVENQWFDAMKIKVTHPPSKSQESPFLATSQ